MKGLYISAIKKSSGKTTLSIAITRLLTDKGYNVATFKKGPDYIDPMWLTVASNGQCFNLDFFFHGKNITEYFYRKADNADFVVVESNHGLFDDVGIMGNKSNAALAKLLGLPVVLVIDVSELGRSVVPIIIGCQQFDENLHVVGIILNRVQNDRHKQKLISAIKRYVNIPVLGVIPDDKNIKIEQRHLGLAANLSEDEMEKKIEFLAEAVEPYIDIGLIEKCAIKIDINRLNTNITAPEIQKIINKKRLVGICYDGAFNFYYANNLEIIKKSGGELVFISPLKDEKLPNIDCLYIGGGFPELFAEILEKNYKFKESLFKYIENGLNVYAECGGLIYLVEELIYKGKNYKMLGALHAKAKFQEKPVAHGYTLLKRNSELINELHDLPNLLKGHEFHHFYLDELRHNMFAYKVLRGKGIKDGFDGILYKNVLASFTHIYDNASNSLFASWINRINLYSNR
jgi:cobyrinic acid a,c-diamide synthase